MENEKTFTIELDAGQSKIDLIRHIENFIAGDVSSYTERVAATSDLITLIDTSHDGEMFLRSNMKGHVTTSALILDKTKTQVLLIMHKLYQKLIPPGGHCEPYPEYLNRIVFDVEIDARREAAEETGVGEGDLTLLLPYPIDIDCHPIPARPEKDEVAHVHHDLMFLFETDWFEPVPQLEEVDAAKWYDVSSLATANDARLVRVYSELLAMGIINQ
jgi:8-oxo-dGTP pyrophosphatase MutT (NUDIX family)